MDGPKAKVSGPPAPEDTSTAAIWRVMFHKFRQISMYDNLAASCLEGVNFNKLVDRINQVHFPGKRARLISGNTTMGGNNLVRVVEFDDGKRAIARVQLKPMNGDRMLRKRSELDTMALVREKSLPVPELYGYALVDRDVGRSYEIMELLPGNALVDVHQIAREHPELFPNFKGQGEYEDHFLRSVAKFQARLTSIRMSKIGSILCDRRGKQHVGPFMWTGGPHVSVRDYLETWSLFAKYPYSEEDVKEDRPERADIIWKSVCEFPYDVQKIAAILGEKDGFGAPFPLQHSDFNSNNVIVDDEQNLVGVVDWDKARTVPWELVEVPGILSYKLPRLIKNPKHWGPDFAPLTDWSRKRLCQEMKYLKFVREAEDEYGLDHNLSSVLGDKRLAVLTQAMEFFIEGFMIDYSVVLPMFTE